MATAARHMRRPVRLHRLVAVLLAVMGATNTAAIMPDRADESVRHFLARDGPQHPYRAERRLEARNGGRAGWMEAATDFSTHAGFRYRVTAEGGSKSIRHKVLRALLEGERQVIALGETARSAIAPENYVMRSNGVDAEGLVAVALSPRRKERVLVIGTMFLRPGDGDLVRLEGRLAKNPSFWVKNVDIVRTYDRINGVVVPVKLESRAQVRFLGAATLEMTYRYSEIDGHPVSTLSGPPP